MDRDRASGEAAASLMTAPGGGGIAVICVQGRGAYSLIAQIFAAAGGSWAAEPPGSLYYGHVKDGDEVLDEVILRVVSCDLFEINCHGGIVAAGEIMRVLTALGAVELAAPVSAERLARAAGLDRVQREALRLVPEAETRLAVQVLCDQLEGALSRAIRGIDIGSEGAAAQVEALCGSAEFGRALTTPRRLALVGAPNVGKSTLFNALVGHGRTIVSPLPGTTRDFITEFIVLGGYPIELSDTAGLRRRGGVVEMKGGEAAWRVVSDADMLLMVLDGSRQPSGEERALMDSLASRGPIVVVNKSDLPPVLTGGEPLFEEVCRVSALEGRGLDVVEQAILRRLPAVERHPPGSAVVFTAEQEDAMRRAGDSLASGDLCAAQRILSQLLD